MRIWCGTHATSWHVRELNPEQQQTLSTGAASCVEFSSEGSEQHLRSRQQHYQLDYLKRSSGPAPASYRNWILPYHQRLVKVRWAYIHASVKVQNICCLHLHIQSLQMLGESIVVVSCVNLAHDHVTSHVLRDMFIHHGPYEQHNKASKTVFHVDIYYHPAQVVEH